MLRRILVPLDGSALAEEALRRMRPLLPGADVVLVRVVPPGAAAEAEAYLVGVGRGLEAEGLRARVRVQGGPPAEGLLAAAEQEKADLIALTTHGRTGLQRWALGSVAEKLVRSSPAPVLVFRSFIGGAPFEPKRILVPVDASGLAMEAIPAAATLARRTGGELILLYVAEEERAHEPEPELRAAWDQARQEGVPVRPLMKAGDPAARILETAAEEQADLVAMTTHGRSGLGRWVLGSVAEKVLRGADRPVLVVRVRPAPPAPLPVPSSIVFA